MTNIPNVLSIAGTDPTGGAGMHADLKSIAAARGYGMAVVTALVAQNTQGVREIHVPEMSFLRAQLDAVSDDVRIDALKIGMLVKAHPTPLLHLPGERKPRTTTRPACRHNIPDWAASWPAESASVQALPNGLAKSPSGRVYLV